MSVQALKIEGLRLFSQAKFSCHPFLNIICGANGAGKTTLLEAIHLLISGRSFRSKDVASLIKNDGRQVCCLSCDMYDSTNLRLQKSLHEATSLKMNARACLSTSELVRLYPSQVFYQDIFQIMDAGPSVRRSFLDWGVFHVKHSYLELIKQYRKALKHRNALLKEGADNRAFMPWDHQLAQLAEPITQMRQDYLNTLNGIFVEVLARVADFSCQLVYDKGWGKGAYRDKSFQETLVAAFVQDRQYRYTRYGPHHADILFQAQHEPDHKMKHCLSRGQQKILLFALKIAQAQLLDKPCIFLVDDMSAELDSQHLQKLLNALKALPGQFFLTCHRAENIASYLASEEYQILTL